MEICRIWSLQLTTQTHFINRYQHQRSNITQIFEKRNVKIGEPCYLTPVAHTDGEVSGVAVVPCGTETWELSRGQHSF
jgi:hypothetical protein